LVGALSETVQVPGPSRGTTATSKRAVSCPLSAPLALFSAGAFTIDVTLEPVTLEEPAPLGALVELEGRERPTPGGGVDVTVTGRLRFTRAGGFVGDVVVVVGAGTSDVVVEMVAVVRDEDGLVAFDGVDVNVKTKTRRRSGLDHITQCVLLSERIDLILVLEGYRRGQRKIFFHSQPLATFRASNEERRVEVQTAVTRERCGRSRRVREVNGPRRRART
jgi:hypothetical protein